MPRNSIESFLKQTNVNVTPTSHKRKVGSEDCEDDEVKRQRNDPDLEVITLSSPDKSNLSQDSIERCNSPLSCQTTPKSTPKTKKFKLNLSSRKKTDPAKEEARRQRELERVKREKEKEEERLKKEAERLKREAEKRAKAEEKQRREEEKKKEKDEKVKQQEDKKKKAEEERLAKIEEKRAKEEEKSRKLEEKQKAEEEKKKALEEEKKKKELVSQKQAQKFKGFFQRLSSASTDITLDSIVQVGPFKPFQLAKDQTLAPVIPQFSRDRFSIDSFDQSISHESTVHQLYLKQLSSGQIKPFKTGKKLRLKIKKQSTDSTDEISILQEQDEADLLAQESIVETQPKCQTFVCKYLGFHENDRPAWFGTWRKKSSSVTGRRPFSKDESTLNYEVDSEDEWEPEDEKGESLTGSDEDEPDDDYDIDNEFMVPHGYLSDEGDGLDSNGDNILPDDPSFRERDMIVRKNMRFKQLKPIVIGPVFKSHANLTKYKIVLNRPFVSM